jgi:hypothetical protein
LDASVVRSIRLRSSTATLNNHQIALFTAEVIQGMGHVLTVKWAIEGRGYTGDFCTVQGTFELYQLAARMTISPLVVFQQLGEPGVALATLVSLEYGMHPCLK